MLAHFPWAWTIARILVWEIGFYGHFPSHKKCNFLCKSAGVKILKHKAANRGRWRNFSDFPEHRRKIGDRLLHEVFLKITMIVYPKIIGI